MIEIDTGDLFTTSTGGTFRLVGVTVDRRGKTAHVFGMDEANSLPKQWDFNELLEGFKDGTHTKLATRGRKVHVRVSDDKPGAKASPAEALRDWRWDLIKPLVNDPSIFLRKKRGQLVADRAKQMTASEQTVMTCLRLYWRGGMTKDALLGNFANCGVSTDSEYSTTNAVRGRVPRNARYEKYQWKSANEQKKVLAAAKRFFHKKKTNTRHYVYRHVVLKFYCVKDAQGNKVQLPPGERPSRAQVLYLLDKHLALEEVLRRKMGDDNYENNAQPKTGSARDFADGIAQYFEIDSTIPDVWICSERDRSVVIGKSTLYLIVDAYSRLIIGFHLTLDAPSWSSAMEAMLSLVEDKEELCARWGWEYRVEDWVAHGAWCQIFRADRGPEFTGYDSDTIAEGIETGISNLPTRKSSLKGTVECSFKLVQVPLRDHVGGHTPSSEQGKRQVDDHKDEATRTLKEVAAEIFSGIRMNNHKVHLGIELPPEDIYKGEQPTPTRLWQRDYEERAGMLTRFDYDDLLFKLLPKADFTVTTSGVFYKGLLWVPEKAQQKKWLLSAVRGAYTRTASFHRNLVDTIYVHDKKDPSKWTTMTLHDKCLQYAGMSFAELEHVKDSLFTLKQLGAEMNFSLEIQHDQEAQAREKAAKALTRTAIANAGARSRTNGAKELRTEEAKGNRVKTRVMASTAGDAGPLPSPRPAPKTPLPSAPQMPVKPAAAAGNQGLQALLNLKSRS